MAYIATFDIGTTAVKGVMMSADGKAVLEDSIGIETVFQGQWKEQRPQDWYAAVCRITEGFFKQGLKPETISGVVMSGQMQDLIPVAEDLSPAGNAILYSDGRAAEQAGRLSDLLGRELIEKSTGNNFDGSMPFAKLLWLKEEQPSIYAKTLKVLISAKDYVITKLTGSFITDVTSASTTGLMDIYSKNWNFEWVKQAGLDLTKLPEICYASCHVGVVSHQAASECGFAPGTPVYAGTGDAGATTLAGGITQEGEYNINLGTSGWIACVSDQPMRKEEVFHLAAMQKGRYINVVPFLNAGNVHKWVCGVLSPNPEGEGKYDYVNDLLRNSRAGSNGVMFLPYLNGERFPVLDTAIKGGYAGITAETSQSDLARSALEGVGFSIRQGMERLGSRPKKISVVGGGARVKEWCQILADILDHSVYAYGGSEYLPSAATAAAALLSQGFITDYASYVAALLDREVYEIFEPDKGNVELYHHIYGKYLKLYPAFRLIQ